MNTNKLASSIFAYFGLKMAVFKDVSNSVMYHGSDINKFNTFRHKMDLDIY